MSRPRAERSTEGAAPRPQDPDLEIELEVLAERPAVARFAGYEILGRIAVGGMAEVFLARERGEGGSARHVALKVIRAQLAASPELSALFLQEGRVAMGLAHPNVCHTLRFGTEQGHPFLVMELVAGVTLRELFARGRRAGEPLLPTIAAKIASSVAEALHSAHVARDERGRALGIVHQDVSPQNVMVGYDGTVKLLDFGVASTSTERASEPVEQSHVTVRGKTAYLSPEQCSGMPIDPRSDVFSLGIVLYEMLTGSRLFARPHGADSMRAIATEPLPVWPGSIPVELQRVLDRALAQEQNDRYPTAAAMQEDLERYLADGRSVVTSATIAKELERLLGDDFGRGPPVDASSDGVLWLRSETETLCEPIPLVKRRAARSPVRALAAALGAAVGAAAISALAAVAVHGLRMVEETPVDRAPLAFAATTETPAEAVPGPPAEPGREPTEPGPVPPALALAALPHEPAVAAEEPARVTPRRPRVHPRRRPIASEEAPSDFVDDPGY